MNEELKKLIESSNFVAAQIKSISSSQPDFIDSAKINIKTIVEPVKYDHKISPGKLKISLEYEVSTEVLRLGLLKI